MEDLIFFVIMALFVLGPIIKKMFEGAQPQNRSSRQDVKEYLERMRTGQAQPQPSGHPQVSPNQRAGQPMPAAPTRQNYGGPAPSGQRQNYGDASRQGQKQRQGSPQTYDARSKPLVTPRPRSGSQADEIVEIVEVVEAKESKPVDSAEKDRRQQAPKKTRGHACGIHDTVLANPRYSDLQRAMILLEIFGKPKAMGKMRRSVP